MSSFFKTLARFFAKVTGFPQLWIYLRPKFYYEDKREKNRFKKGGAIIISNHTSLVDYFTLAITFPFRKQRVLVSEALYQHAIPALMSRMMDDIVVHRERSDMSFMAEAEKTLKKKHCVTIFPEGHLMKNGQVDTFRPSAVYLALRTGAPIIPTYIEPHYNSLKRTRIIIGKKIYLSDYCQKVNPSIEEVRELCEMLRKRVLELKRTLFLYRKMKTYNIINFKAWFFDIAKALLWLPTKFVFPTKFHYVGKATRKDRRIVGRGIVVSKHFSFKDPPILDMHYFSRRVRIIIAEELYNTLPWLFSHLMCIEYRRVSDSSDPKCFMEVINTLRANGVVGIYPEGHITVDRTGKLFSGAAYFALMSNAPIYIYWSMNPFRYFHRNHVMIGEPIYPDKLFTLEEMKKKETVNELNTILTERINELQKLGEKYIKKSKKSQKNV